MRGPSPRLTGLAKAAFVAIEFDEFGGGRSDHVHQQLFADLMVAAGLDASYLGYIDAVPAESLAVVNLMSYFGLHREHRGAAIGHFASTEITSSPGGSRRLVEAMERMGAPGDVREVLPGACRGRRRARAGRPHRCRRGGPGEPGAGAGPRRRLRHQSPPDGGGSPGRSPDAVLD